MISIEIQYTDRCSGRFAQHKSGKTWSSYSPGTHQQEDVEQDAIKVEEWLKDYSRFTIYLEDTILVSPSPYRIVSFDTVNATIIRAVWTDEELVAVLKLALFGDDVEDAAALYAIAEPAVKDWPTECRPIP